jgi:hypothetical protein
LFFFIIVGCSSGKTSFHKEENYEDAILYSIMDFSNTTLFSKGKVFNLGFEIIEDRIYYIDIMDNLENKFLYSEKKKFEDNKLPNRFRVYKNKLFVWWDDNYSSDRRILEQLISNNVIQNSDVFPFIDIATDDKLKGAKYFFCKKNLKEYKRIITNKGFVPIPKIKCK